MLRPFRRLLLLSMSGAVLALAACTPRPPQSTQPVTAPPSQAAAPLTGSGKIKVALLLPLGGRAEALGQALQEAAEMALFDGAGRSIAITTYDTGDTPQGAVDAFNRARSEGTALLLGPLFGPSARSVAPLAREAGLNMISFSNDEQIAQPGLWVMGLAAGPQVRRVVDFAIGRGIRNFGIVAPQTAYGQQVSEVFENHVRSRSASLIGRETIAANSDPAAAVRRLAGNVGDPTATAILMPLAGQALSPALAALKTAQGEGRRSQLLGTGLWDDLEDWQISGLAGAWYAAPDPAQRADFERRFTATYGKPAPRLATLAYDAVRFAAALATRRPGGDFSAAAIADPAGMAGVDGALRFLPDGRVERALAVMQVGSPRSSVIGAPAAGFDRPGL